MAQHPFIFFFFFFVVVVPSLVWSRSHDGRSKNDKKAKNTVTPSYVFFFRLFFRSLGLKAWVKRSDWLEKLGGDKRSFCWRVCEQFGASVHYLFRTLKTHCTEWCMRHFFTHLGSPKVYNSVQQGLRGGTLPVADIIFDIHKRTHYNGFWRLLVSRRVFSCLMFLCWRRNDAVLGGMRLKKDATCTSDRRITHTW
jgi:hypothetical protein